MSSSGDLNFDPNSTLIYYCPQCESVVAIVPIDDEPVCPICGDTFLEEVLFPGYNSYPSSFELRNSGDFAILLGLESTPSRSQSPDSLSFDPQAYFQDLVELIFSSGGSIQVNFNGDEGEGRSPARSIGDYVFGSGFENVVQQLSENDPSRYGPPPATRAAVEALPIIEISSRMVSDDEEAHCAVCRDAFEVGDEAMRMPCMHLYHEDCLVRWLELHNSCPVCRYALPTDDSDHSSRDTRAAGAGRRRNRETGAGEEESSSGRRGTRRRARVSLSLPWSLRCFGGRSQRSEGTSDGNNGSSLDEELEGLHIHDPDRHRR